MSATSHSARVQWTLKFSPIVNISSGTVVNPSLILFLQWFRLWIFTDSIHEYEDLKKLTWYFFLERTRYKVNFWCSVMKNLVTGSFFFSEKAINGIVHLNLLISYCFPQLVELKNMQKLNFPQDGAPLHFTGYITDALNEKLGNRWIGRQGSILWPPRSSGCPDMTPSEFLLWGYIKNIYHITLFMDKRFVT